MSVDVITGWSRCAESKWVICVGHFITTEQVHGVLCPHTWIRQKQFIKNLLTINGYIVHHLGELLLFRKKEET